MPGVRVVQVPAHEVIGVIAVRHALVPAAGAVRVAALVRAARVRGRAVVAVRPTHREHVLVRVIAVDVVQVPVVQVVGVVLVPNGRMAAAIAVAMSVLGVRVMVAHSHSPFTSLLCSAIRSEATPY
jgi:hypothetical protein